MKIQFVDEPLPGLIMLEDFLPFKALSFAVGCPCCSIGEGSQRSFLKIMCPFHWELNQTGFCLSPYTPQHTLAPIHSCSSVQIIEIQI